MKNLTVLVLVATALGLFLSLSSSRGGERIHESRCLQSNATCGQADPDGDVNNAPSICQEKMPCAGTVSACHIHSTDPATVCQGVRNPTSRPACDFEGEPGDLECGVKATVSCGPDPLRAGDCAADFTTTNDIIPQETCYVKDCSNED